MSQNQAILDYLKAGHSLTGLDALKLMGTMKLASRISELRDERIDIKDETIHNKDTGKHYKRYWITLPNAFPGAPRKAEKRLVELTTSKQVAGNPPESKPRLPIVEPPSAKSKEPAKDELSEMVSQGNLAQETVINYKEVGKQLEFAV